MHSRRLIQSVNTTEEGAEAQKQRMRIGLIKSYDLNPQEGKAKWSQARLVYVPQDLSHVYWYQEQRLKKFCYDTHNHVRIWRSQNI